MKLYLIRHGQYVPIDVSMTCPLSFDGEADIKRLATHLSRIRVKVPHIFHSSKTRARQTAEILAAQLQNDSCALLDGLEPDAPIEPIINKISTCTEDIMLVGHLPFIGKLTSQLLVSDHSFNLVDYQPGTAVCLAHEGGQWHIKWALTPGTY